MNTFGNKFRVSIFGESHGERIGVTLDGVLPGIPLSEADFAQDLARRKAGALGTTPRVEADEPEIVSGVYEGHTTGAPLTILFRNENTRSEDYEQFRQHPRPGHADFTANLKFGGFNDLRGGGHFSGRLTLGIVAAGVVAKKMLYFAQFHAALTQVGGIKEADQWPEALKAAQADGDSLGGIVECVVENLPIGLGEPFWDSVESRISHAVFAIPGVRGIEFGDGFAAAAMRGSEHNDPFPEHHCHHEEGEEHHCCHGEHEEGHECQCHGDGGCHHDEEGRRASLLRPAQTPPATCDQPCRRRERRHHQRQPAGVPRGLQTHRQHRQGRYPGPPRCVLRPPDTGYCRGHGRHCPGGPGAVG